MSSWPRRGASSTTWRGNIDYRHTCVLVLDEADRMLDMGFIKDVLEIVREVPRIGSRCSSRRPSARISRACRRSSSGTRLDRGFASGLHRRQGGAVHHQGEPGGEGRRPRGPHPEVLTCAGRSFSRRRRSARPALASHLRRHGIRAEAIHSNRSQEERVRTLEAFRREHLRPRRHGHRSARASTSTRSPTSSTSMSLRRRGLRPPDRTHRAGRTWRHGPSLS
ncbi:MAG: DEAD/DEAH box helicase [Candidatus Eisenbacteria bacterium]|nr:DEAD/DEAH box helicase [Candidatus Eisenbacteria bacterium]